MPKEPLRHGIVDGGSLGRYQFALVVVDIADDEYGLGLADFRQMYGEKPLLAGDLPEVLEIRVASQILLFPMRIPVRRRDLWLAYKMEL